MPLLSRKADYAILILAWLQERPGQGCARAIADGYGLSRPFVANILKELCHKGFVTSRRGVKGGYRLGRPASGITLADLLEALDDTFRLAECSRDSPGEVCCVAPLCPVRGQIAEVHRRIGDVLRGVTLAGLTSPATPTASPCGLQSIGPLAPVASTVPDADDLVGAGADLIGRA
jgi:Rrf2 family protein